MVKTFDLVLEGGGTRGIVLNAAVETLEAQGHSIRRVIGTSAGAIGAACLAIGFSGAELVAASRARTDSGAPVFSRYIDDPPDGSTAAFKDSSLHRWLLAQEERNEIPRGIAAIIAREAMALFERSRPARSLFSFVEEGGIVSGDGFVQWLSETFESKLPGASRLTMSELFRRTGRHLTVMATDTTNGRSLVLNHITAPELPVVMAVRMSMSIPLFFNEVVWRREWGTYLGNAAEGVVVVDGGVLSNFPLRFILDQSSDYTRTFMGSPEEPGGAILGLSIDTRLEVPGAPPPPDVAAQTVLGRLAHLKLIRRIANLSNTVLSGNDDTIRSLHETLVCSLPAQTYSAVEFSMSEARVAALLAAGSAAMQAYLARYHSV